MPDRNGPMAGLRVVELASEQAAFAGQLLAGMGADVVVVEPPGGHHTRGYEPFADDRPDPEASLWWWFYNVGKRGVVVDLEDAEGQAAFRRLVATADVVLEAEPPGRLAQLGIDYADCRPLREDVIWVSVTPFGPSGPRIHEPSTDLTLLAGGGPVWNCGYDDHSIPPVRGGGNQAYHVGSVFAVLSTLTALIHREATGQGQRADVSLYAAANVTCEAGTYTWLVSGETVQRQTGRHASVRETLATQIQAADGRYVNTGVQPRRAAEFESVLGWLDELGIRQEFPDTPVLELAAAHGGISHSDIEDNALIAEMARAGRDAMVFIVSHVGAYDAFVGAQERGLPCGVVYSPEESLADPHMVARGMNAVVEQAGRPVIYPAPPLAFTGGRAALRPPPRIGEHNDEIFDHTEAT